MASTNWVMVMLLLAAGGDAPLEADMPRPALIVAETPGEILQPMPADVQGAEGVSSRFWFPPPRPCKPKSYLSYRANYFGYGCFNPRDSIDYPWRRPGYCGCRPLAPQLMAPIEGAPLEPTPAPLDNAKRPVRRWPRLF